MNSLSSAGLPMTGSVVPTGSLTGVESTLGFSSLLPSGQSTYSSPPAQSIGSTVSTSQAGRYSNSVLASTVPPSSASSAAATSALPQPSSSPQTSFSVAPSTGLVPQPVTSSQNGQVVTQVSSVPVASVTQGPVVSGTDTDVETTDACMSSTGPYFHHFRCPLLTTHQSAWPLRFLVLQVVKYTLSQTSVDM